VSYRVQFYNRGGEPVRLSWAVRGTERLADSLSVKVVDGSGVEAAGGLLWVTVPAKGTAERVVTVGGLQYHRTQLGVVKPLAQLSAYPNPVRGRLTVQFMLPPGMGGAVVTLVDARGRVAWREEIRGVSSGMNRVVWDGRAGGTQPAAAGVYVLRVEAMDGAGRRTAVKERRVMVVR
jgi:hypothetical protein